MSTSRNAQWLCLFLEDLKSYAEERDLLETAAAIELAVVTATRELDERSARIGADDVTMTKAPSKTPDKLQ